MKTLPADCTAPIEVVSMRAPRVPADLLHYSALTQARRSTSARLSGLELPSCFIEATVSATLSAHERSTVAAKASRRRLASKVARLGDRS